MPTNYITEATMTEALRELESPFGRQAAIEFMPGVATATARADYVVRVRWQGGEAEFAAEAKAQNTPRVLEDALRTARRWAAESGKMPMVIVPFLGEKRIERLADEGVSGLDLCGNGIIMIPGRLFLQRTGQPNRYPESRPARFAYRSATSLVPRVFLRRAVYESVGQIKTEIEAAGGSIALSTVSKALARMADDFIIDRSQNRIALLQPDKLLDALANEFSVPTRDRVINGKLEVSLKEMFRRFAPSSGSGSPVVLSGASSQDRYAAGMRGDMPTIYCKDAAVLRDRMSGAWQPTERFADLMVIETRDPTPFFDARTDTAGVVYASPVQTYLELVAGDEKRDVEIAQQVRARILGDIGR